jgi:very-short-patch-repair endonuclease
MLNATINQARSLRLRSTSTEVRLWNRLRDRRFGGHKFLRQRPVGPYIADFVCREANLIVEVDGSGHAMKAKDAERDSFLVSRSFSVLRFWNSESQVTWTMFAKQSSPLLRGGLNHSSAF